MSGPPEPDAWVPIRVAITDTHTGEIRERITAWPMFRAPWDVGEYDTIAYGWSDGNYSCDCNRGNQFARARNEPDPNLPCGDSRFRVRVHHAQTGELIYEDQ